MELRVEDGVAILTINRPAVLNALNFGLIGGLERLLDSVARSEARALIVTGAGEKAFCAGADISELRGRQLDAEREGARLGQRVFAKLDGLPMPSIALVNGYAFGGGLELALACTFRLASPNATFALPEIKLGLIPGYGGTQRLPRLIGEARALELILSGRAIDAEEAARIGLINHVVSGDALAEAIAFARRFTGYGKLAGRLARDAVRRGLATTLEQGFAIEADLSTLAYRTRDAAEGMAAFLEKRPARFEDR